jgi:hypothetical protein
MCFYKRNEMKPGEIGMDEKRLLIVLVHVYKNAKNVLNIIIISIITCMCIKCKKRFEYNNHIYYFATFWNMERNSRLFRTEGLPAHMRKKLITRAADIWRDNG